MESEVEHLLKTAKELISRAAKVANENHEWINWLDFNTHVKSVQEGAWDYSEAQYKDNSADSGWFSSDAYC